MTRPPLSALAFTLVSLGVFAVLSMRFLPLVPLYLHAGTRAQTQTALNAIAEAQGWLVSDMAITDVTDQSMTFEYHPHHRGGDSLQCHQYCFTHHVLQSCGSSCL